MQFSGSGSSGGGGGGDATAANQVIGNTSLSNIDTDLGAQADAAATTDTGTFSIIAFIKRGMQNWTSLLARIPALVSGRVPVDGSGVTQPVNSLPLFTFSTNNSTNGDSSPYTLTTGNTWTGTLDNTINQSSALVAVITNQTVTVTVNQYIDAAGLVPEVPAVSYTVTAGTSPYSFPIVVQGNYFKVSVSNSSGSTATIRVDTYFGPAPIVPLSLSQLGNFKTAIAEALPAGTNAIGSILGQLPFSAAVTITRPANITTYAVNGVLSTATTGLTAFPTFALGIGSNKRASINNITLISSNGAAAIKGQFAIHLFNSASPSGGGFNDAAAFAPTAAALATTTNELVGVVPSLIPMGTAAYGYVLTNDTRQVVTDASGNVYLAIVLQNAYTPASGETITVVVSGTY
jgi:hypothetical protein